MKLIDKSALVAEIERLKNIQLSIFNKGETQENCYDSLTCISVYNEILSLINSLEVKEVNDEPECKIFPRPIGCYSTCKECPLLTTNNKAQKG